MIQAEALYLLLDATKSLIQTHDTVWASMVKQTIKRKHPSFNETYHGYPTFSKLVEDAVSLDLVKATKDSKSGNYRIEGLGTAHPKA